ncbi:MAG: dihydrofolate reductase [Candidatus Pacebacteria bacterium]|nr:dihydrofolate reductase [Candidatus Paceibacterota bacterium]MDD4467358.1 dihydrofolate reductase [Candidatus Paceibacterota bacterium]MDD4897408.1 dihydrofolate reductase [Candidatus Paceibacterota bacterium]
MKIIIIAAVSKNNVIGKGSKIPWHSKEDFSHFKEKTLNNVVLMGRKTYESIGKALPRRKNIVITGEKKSFSDAERYDSYKEGLTGAKEYAKKNNCDIFIIGGGSIYNQAIEDADFLYISHMKSDFEGDVFFPDFEKTKKWTIKSKEEFNDFTFIVWERR